VATQTCTFTDIDGSTAMAGRPGHPWAGVLADHHQLIGAALAREGQVVMC
jgi:hypothetical protein